MITIAVVNVSKLATFLLSKRLNNGNHITIIHNSIYNNNDNDTT